MSVSRGPLKPIADTLICPYCGTQNAVYPGKTDRIDPGRLEEALITGGPMPNLISEFSISVFLRGHAILSEVLRKGEAHALERNIAPSVLLTARLFPDMLPLTGRSNSRSTPPSVRLPAWRLSSLPVLTITRRPLENCSPELTILLNLSKRMRRIR